MPAFFYGEENALGGEERRPEATRRRGDGLIGSMAGAGLFFFLLFLLCASRAGRLFWGGKGKREEEEEEGAKRPDPLESQCQCEYQCQCQWHWTGLARLGLFGELPLLQDTFVFGCSAARRSLSAAAIGGASQEDSSDEHRVNLSTCRPRPAERATWMGFHCL